MLSFFICPLPISLSHCLWRVKGDVRSLLYTTQFKYCVPKRLCDRVLKTIAQCTDFWDCYTLWIHTLNKMIYECGIKQCYVLSRKLRNETETCLNKKYLILINFGAMRSYYNTMKKWASALILLLSTLQLLLFLELLLCIPLSFYLCIYLSIISLSTNWSDSNYYRL